MNALTDNKLVQQKYSPNFIQLSSIVGWSKQKSEHQMQLKYQTSESFDDLQKHACKKLNYSLGPEAKKTSANEQLLSRHHF